MILQTFKIDDNAMIFQNFYSLFIQTIWIFYFPFFVFIQASDIEQLVPQIVGKIPHDQQAFTQGLAIEGDQLYESTGLYGKSSVRHINLQTGKILKIVKLPSDFFAEGIAAFPSKLFLLSWKEHKAFVFDRHSLKWIKTLFYLGEGWGLCREGDHLWMSNGTSKLTKRDSKNFSVLKTLHVQKEGRPVIFLNDLECDGKYLYANIWQKESIVRIDKESGKVTGVIDASHLLNDDEKARLNPDEVLNGIAYRSKTETFFVTGKGWPWVFEVRFISK